MEVIKIQIVLTTCKPEAKKKGGFEIKINSGLFVQKILYTRETIRGIGISPYRVKILTFFMIGWDPWIKKGVNYLSGI